MKIKDKAYEEHLKRLAMDRDKEFANPKLASTEAYVRDWCAKNGLRHPGLGPLCKCGQPCHYYGAIGGYSRKCKECNEKNAARQRAARAKRK